MKRSLFYIILALLIVLVACNGDEEPAGGEADSSSQEKEEETGEQAEDSNQENNTEEDTEETQEVIEREEAAGETAEPEYKISENWSVVPMDDAANEEVVLLTIDDAPDTYALEMAKTLNELDANAIFFVNGHFLDTPEQEEELKEIHDMGFVIGNHTYNHPTLTELSEEEQEEEIVDLSNRVEEIIGERPKFFRAPHGANTDYSIQVAEEEGMTVMNWSFGYDWNEEYMNKDAISDIMVNTDLLSNGSNLLMHDREWTAAGLEDIVTGLRDKGFEIVDPHLIEKP